MNVHIFLEVLVVAHLSINRKKKEIGIFILQKHDNEDLVTQELIITRKLELVFPDTIFWLVFKYTDYALLVLIFWTSPS